MSAAATTDEHVAAILEQCARAERARVMAGLDPATARIFLLIRRKSRPKNWRRVRVAPGVYGHCIGRVEDGIWHVDALASDIRAFIKRASEAASKAVEVL